MSGNSTTPSSSRRQDWISAWALLALTVIVFWPVVRWLATQTFAHEQLKQSFFIVLLAGAWITWEKRHTLQFQLRFSNEVLTWLFASYVLAAAALFKTPLLFVAGMVAAAGGMVNYVFGGRAFKRTLPLLSVFALLVLCVLLFPVLDWPLRRMAGVESARLLKSLGLAPHLAISTATAKAQLLLTAGGRSFVVATECNGFGLITSSLLLGMIRLLYQRATWRWFALLLPLCVSVAFAFNFLRITTIVLFAPRFPAQYYSVVHETAGIIALYTGLGLVWLLTGVRRQTGSVNPPASIPMA